MWPLATKLKTIVMTRKTFVDNSVNFNNFERSDNFKNINSNMKKEYTKPTMSVVETRQHGILCNSDVINPGDPNQPAGSPSLGDFEDWDL